ncbi:MAG: hypothetical protein IJC76_04590 [Lachnospiraceae bacterium]|nr:hypothetical protein [Lachnospiraceae bacterium]
MDYNEFLSYIKDSITTIIGEERQVNIHKIIKNNDIELDGLSITSSSHNISPTIYLNDYYNDYLNGANIGDIVYDIYGIYEQQNKNIDFDLSFFADFNQIKSRIMAKLINYNSNQKLLLDVPHVRFLDLAIVFYCFIENDTFGNATVLIHTSHMQMWNVTENELYKYSMINTPLIFPPIITNMNEVIQELLISKMQNQYITSDNQEDIFSFEEITDNILNIISEETSSSMYILTNSHKMNGSICMLYQDVLKDFSNKINSDIIILPSSIHEIILIPYADDLSPEQLNKMVKDVNTNEVDSIDVLSDHIYKYDMANDKIIVL